MACTIHSDEIKRLSAQGISNTNGSVLFTIHVLTNNGALTAAQTRVLAEVSEAYGNGELSFSAQTTVAVCGVHYSNIDTVLSCFSQVGLITGGTGSRIHPIVACRGTSCRFGLCDTLALYKKMHERIYLGYHDVELSHKFKIAIGGCPNNCAKPNLSDIGIMGQVIPGFDPTLCKNCASCSVQASCPMEAPKMINGTLRIDPEICNHCGRCANKCPSGAVSRERAGIAVYIGGRSGKKITPGRPLEKLFVSEEDVLNVVERAILLYRDLGAKGERFADTIERIGFKNVQQQLLSGKILKQKQESPFGEN